MAPHEIVRSRREVVRRTLTVVDRQMLTPHMLRILFHSAELAGFDSPSPDDHIKVFLPEADGSQVKRDFTPRAWDVDAGTVTLEFALHETGPATAWARGAKPGDTVQIGGPKGSSVVPDDFDWYLLVGDACALPSIARRLQQLRSGVPVYVVALVRDAGEQQQLETSADARVTWLYESGDPSADAATVRSAVQALQLPPGDGFIWIAGEAEMSREVYRHAVQERGHAPEWVKSSAYWTRGGASD